MVYHKSDIITDFRLALRDVQTPNELYEVSPRVNCQLHKCIKLSELTSGANYEINESFSTRSIPSADGIDDKRCQRKR